jgi:hypothetical protein
VRKRLAIVAIVLSLLALAVAAVAYLLYRGSQRVPEFYRRALEMDEERERQASLEMAANISSLVNDVKKEGRWQAVFTAEQINGWLAVDAADEETEGEQAQALLEHPADLLPPYLSDPRVAIEPEQLWIACRFERDDWTSVLSLPVEIYLAEPNVIALRIRQVRAGVVRLPLPLEKVLDSVMQAAHERDLQVHRGQIEGDPLIEISIPPLSDEEDKVIRLETLQLGEGKVYVAGSTERL